MWTCDDYIHFLSLFGINDTVVVDRITSSGLNKSKMDSITTSTLNSYGVQNPNVCALVVSQWKDHCSTSANPATALEIIEENIVCVIELSII